MREAAPGGHYPNQPSLYPSHAQGSSAQTHNSWVRHSPEGINFPEKDSKTPYIRLGGEFLSCGWKNWHQILGI
jgi:hypothetical protein